MENAIPEFIGILQGMGKFTVMGSLA